MKKKFLFSFLSIFLLVFLADSAFAGWFDGWFAPEVPKVTAIQLMDEYTSNETKADKNYKGKQIEVTGKILNIDVVNNDNIVVTFESGNLLSGITDLALSLSGISDNMTGDLGLRAVWCYFPRSSVRQIAQLQNGDIITVTGICQGLFISVRVTQCTLKRPEISTENFWVANVNGPVSTSDLRDCYSKN